MTDRELLEMAAKATGIDISSATFDGWGDVIQSSWNPLADDGDALRLAVDLDIDIVHAFGARTAVSPETVGYPAEGADPYAATRRAIVRAAAEIGRSMP